MGPVELLALAGALYGLRLAGLLLARGAVARSGTRLLENLPAATLAALVVVGLASRPDEAAWRWPAAAAAALVAARRPRMEVCMAVGMGVYGLLRLVAAH